MESNEVEAVAILQALGVISSVHSYSFVVVESDSSNPVSWVSNPCKVPWRFHFYFSEIKALFLWLRVNFQYVGRFADGFAKQGVDTAFNLILFTM